MDPGGEGGGHPGRVTCASSTTLRSRSISLARRPYGRLPGGFVSLVLANAVMLLTPARFMLSIALLGTMIVLPALLDVLASHASAAYMSRAPAARAWPSPAGWSDPC